ncbi:chemotaxis protein CheA [Hyphomonas sp.]|uniref:chemotaxis protein CheA n=1 Tax=Hyphomonas sp. TaxID=87 RepID=UPI0025C2C5AD|nr:chemotaxis protein CheA [Hyphomonas sp.]
MDTMDEIRETFFLECEDLLQDLETGLTSIRDGDRDPEKVNSVFRAVHSIKGGAGAFALNDLVRFAHKFETTLDEVRAGRLEPQTDLIALFLRSADFLADLVASAQSGDQVDGEQIDHLISELESFIDSDNAAPSAENFVFEPIALDFSLDFDAPPPPPAEDGNWRITLSPHENLFARGNDSVLLLRALRLLGDYSVTCDWSDLLLLDHMDCEKSYLKWSLTMPAMVTETAIREVFEFVEDECDLKIERTAVSSAPRPAPVETQTPSKQAPAASLQALHEDSDHGPSPGASADANGKDAGKAPKATVRVELDRVDRLINLIGELVINQSMLSQAVFDAGFPPNSPLAGGLDEFKQLTRDIQESVMSIRAQPVKPLFQRMSRIVREASNATRKDVRLVTEGESTEVDKIVIERLSDPLTHMIRNAVDHGLESREKREAAGKPREGVVRLSAMHRSGRVIIEVSDDGAGINRPRVRQIAIEKGLISADEQLTDGEIDNLLFMPGFSTASEVSNLSGRGVGMDVVKKSIQALGGRVSIVSVPGQGSSFIISLPLTLAILDGMVVRIAGQTTIIPLTDIVETLKPKPEDIHYLSTEGQVVFIRGAFVPLVDVGATLGYRAPLTKVDNQIVVLTQTEDSALSALLVDEIFDQRQVVIKGLEENYGSVPGIAAATILGDGRIALILDVDRIVSRKSMTADLSEAA